MPAKSPTPRPIVVYGFDIDRVRPGDILFTRAHFELKKPSTYKSKAIRIGDGGKFSHVALCIEYGHFIEAIGWGVCRLAIMLTGARYEDNVQLFRLRPDVPNASDIAQRAAECGHEYLTREYSVRAALGVKIRPLRNTSLSEMFCSALVVRAYQQAGLPLVPKKRPEAIGPARLMNSQYLEDVTPTALIAIHTDSPPSFYLDDGSASQRPHQWEIVRKQKMLTNKKVKAALRALKASPSSFYELECLLRDPDEDRRVTLKDLDDAVHGVLVNERFAETYLQRATDALDLEVAAATITVEVDRAKSGNMDNDELLAQIRQSKQIITLLKNDLRHRKVEYDNYKRRALRDGFRTLHYLGNLQGEFISLSRRTLDLNEVKFDAFLRVAADRGL
jgi:hypothetical protein